MKHTIAVLQDDIDNGEPGSTRGCAIARAANRELFRDDITVSGSKLHAGKEFHANLPTAATAFIPKFDIRLPVEPFKFEIEEIPGQAPPMFSGMYTSITSKWAADWAGDLIFGTAHLSPMNYLSYSKPVAPRAEPWKPRFGTAALTYAPSTWTPPSAITSATN